MLEPRATCLRCRRPKSVCFCALVPSIPTRTRVVFLQHPRERTVAVGTCRMAHLALPNSELHVGVSFDADPRVQELAAAPAGETVVLFPGEKSVDASLLGSHPRTLVVIDGTWIQAQKVLERNRLLRSLPRLSFTPERPGNYRIRREPDEQSLSTIEAVAGVLGRLEGEPDRFRPMLTPFERMVDWQLAHRAAREGPSRTRRKRHRQARTPAVPTELTTGAGDVVLLYAEGNAHGPGTAVKGPAELMHLVAERPATGSRFEALIAPRRPLAPNAPSHLEVPAEALLGGERVVLALERFRAFARTSDLVCLWGTYAGDLLRAEGISLSDLVDLRRVCARVLGRRPGGIEPATVELGIEPAAPWAKGRAGRRLAGLAGLVRHLAPEANLSATHL